MRVVVLAALAYTLTMRVAELVLSARNARALAGRGGKRIEPDGMAAIAAVHALWIVGIAAEEFWRGPSLPSVPVRVLFAALFVLAECVRFWCIATLGVRWNVRVIVLPGVPPIRRGPYRIARHPNYAAVVAGLVALPLALGLVAVPIAILPLKLAALRRRLQVENAVF